MKKLSKVIGIILLIFLVSAVLVVLAINIFANRALKAGIEIAATKTLNVKVGVGDVDLSIMGGKLGLQKLEIDNPPGYQHDKMLELKEAKVGVNIKSLLSDVVEIKEIKLDGVNVVIEQKGFTSNIQEIIKALPKAEAEKPEDAIGKPAKKLHIDNLEITNVTVKVKLLPVPGKSDTVPLNLNPIRMTDLGSDNKMDLAKLSAKILLAIAAGVAEQGAGQLPKDMTDGMKATLSEAKELGKTAAEKGKQIFETGKDEGKEIIGGFKDLIKKAEEGIKE